MQTFVPETTSFTSIAQVLDRQRLNKQALEGWQILMTLLELDPQGNHRVPKGWVNHPAVKMWRGHEMALYLRAVQLGIITEASSNPYWISNQEQFKEIASSHRVALLNKDYEWYSQFGWPEDRGYKPETYEYIWPV